MKHRWLNSEHAHLPQLLLFAAGYLFVNILAIFLSGNDWHTAHAFLVGAVLLAIFAGIQRARTSSGPLRQRWILLLAAFALYITALIGLPFPGLTGLLGANFSNTFTVVGIGMALRLLAVSSPPEDLRSYAVRGIDALLTLLICALAIMDLYLPLRNVADMNIVRTHLLGFTCAFKLFVAVTAMIAVAGTSSPQEYRFYRAFTIFQWMDAGSIFLTNFILFLHFHLDNTPADALVTASYLAFAILTFLPQEHLSNPVRSASVRYLVRSAMPIFLMVAVFGLASRLMMLHLQAGLAATGTAILLYGLRLAITQSQYMHARDRMEAQSMIDGLTTVKNRRAFDFILREEWQRTQRSRDSLALLLLDVDYFKKLNDAYGHQMGDACLIAVARCIRDQLTRSSDHIFRYGGEEFAVLLPGARLNGAMLIAELIRKAVETLAIPGLQHPITVSIGVAVCEPHSFQGTTHAIIQSADKALYAAKHEGRNRVVHAPAINHATT